MEEDKEKVEESIEWQSVPTEFTAQSRGHCFKQVTVQGQARTILGDVHYHGIPLNVSREPDYVKSFGLCLGQAPNIAPEAFKGRAKELLRIRNWLIPTNHPRRQCIVSVVGLGGVGKTQLSLAHVRECAEEYSSVFWVDARDESSLRRDLAALSTIIYPESLIRSVQSADAEEKAIERVRQWLSEPENSRWLLIFDNYDDPKLPGIRSNSGYDIRPFFPTRSHGSFLITTRSSKLAFSVQLQLGKLEDVSESVSLLSQRSGRDLSNDPEAVELAKRLGGLPLALATAGTFLASTSISCAEYCDLYESMWGGMFGNDAEELYEYPERTLSSTWTISFNHVRALNEDAAELLQFLAFFSPQDIWYELIKAGASSAVPWICRVTRNHIHFTRAMAHLCNYSLVEITGGSYQLHTCFHDWLVHRLPSPPPKPLFVAALRCVIASIPSDSSPKGWAKRRRLSNHMEHLGSDRLVEGWRAYIVDETVSHAAQNFATEQSSLGLFLQAEKMLIRVLDKMEISLGPSHTSTLQTLNFLGSLYRYQGRLHEAEQMSVCTLKKCEKSLGPVHSLTLDIVVELGIQCLAHGRIEEAEQLLVRALAGLKEILRPSDPSILCVITHLSAVYVNQGKLEEAESLTAHALPLYANLFGTSELSPEVIHNYTSLLCWGIQMTKFDRSKSIQRISKLISFVKNQGRKDCRINDRLGRALVFLNDYKNARKAYLHAVTYTYGELTDVCAHIFCDGCLLDLRLINIKVGRHICTMCLDLDLCDQCMAKYNNGTLKLPLCSGHTFFDVGKVIWSGLDCPMSEGSILNNSWIDEIMEEYTTGDRSLLR